MGLLTSYTFAIVSEGCAGNLDDKDNHRKWAKRYFFSSSIEDVVHRLRPQVFGRYFYF